jgi:hypothetical protein
VLKKALRTTPINTGCKYSLNKCFLGIKKKTIEAARKDKRITK